MSLHKCPECLGKGKNKGRVCNICRGMGYIEVTEVKIEIDPSMLWTLGGNTNDY